MKINNGISVMAWQWPSKLAYQSGISVKISIENIWRKIVA
jgi:hypothetical protein